MNTKVDFKKTLPSYKAKSGVYSIIEVPSLRYLMIDGADGPESPVYIEAIQTLYPVAYKLKFASKQDLQRDYVVPPFESLWWAEDMSAFTTNFDKSQWLWSAMLMMPDWITDAMFQNALDIVSAKNKPKLLDQLRLAELPARICVQTLHLGSFANEGPVLKTMHESFIPDNGYTMTGKHHEIYFSDFRKTAPEKLRTLLRQPVEKALF